MYIHTFIYVICTERDTHNTTHTHTHTHTTHNSNSGEASGNGLVFTHGHGSRQGREDAQRLGKARV